MRRPHKIELWSEAEDDFDNSYTYYAERSEQVADDFYQHIKNCLDKISQTHLHFLYFTETLENVVFQNFHS